MGKKLLPDDMELYQRTDEVLHYLWDPIGISDIPEARDEYYSYLPHVFNMLKNAENGKDISEYLISTERDTMGLTVTESSKERALEIAEILINYRDWIKEKAEQRA